MTKPSYEELEARNHDLLDAVNSVHQWYTTLDADRRSRIRRDVFMNMRRVTDGEPATRLDRVQLFKNAVFAACAVRNREGAEDWSTFDSIMEKLA